MWDVNNKLSQFAAGELSYDDMQKFRKELENQRETTEITKNGLKNALKTLDAGIAEVQELNDEVDLWADTVDWDERAAALQELAELDDMEMEEAHAEMEEQRRLERETERVNKRYEEVMKESGIEQKAEDDRRALSRGRGPDLGAAKAAQAGKAAEQQAQVAAQGNETGGENAQKAAEEAKKKKEEEITAMKATLPSPIKNDENHVIKNDKKTLQKSSETSSEVTQPIIEQNTKTWKPQEQEEKQEYKPQKSPACFKYVKLIAGHLH